jgi:hypothetical protein
MPSSLDDKNSEPIKEGDQVWTPIRGGRHEGDVDKIVMTEEEANGEEVKDPPKVIFTDQHGHRVVHNPRTLQHAEAE